MLAFLLAFSEPERAATLLEVGSAIAIGATITCGFFGFAWHEISKRQDRMADDFVKLGERIGDELKEAADAIAAMNVRLTVLERMEALEDEQNQGKGKRR